MFNSRISGLGLAAAVAALTLSGCVVQERVRVGGPVVRERGGVEVRFTPLVCTERVVVRERPPALREEIIVARPSSQHVWIGGHWYRHNNAWLWVHGCWSLPPPHMAGWAPGHWVDRHGDWIWAPGHWR